MKRSLIIMSLSLLLTLSSAFAKRSPLTVIEGKFSGANCMFFMKSCPDDMPAGHVASEPDFVIVQPGGNFYYVTNISRHIKAKYLHKEVRIKGKFNKQGTFVASWLEVKKNGKYRKVKMKNNIENYGGSN